MPEDNFEETRSAMTEQNGQWYGKYLTPYLGSQSLLSEVPESRQVMRSYFGIHVGQIMCPKCT